MVAKKKKEDTSDVFVGGTKQIAISAKLVEKEKKKYFNLEEEQEPVTSVAGQNWFDFLKQKYYPIVILENGAHVIQIREKVEIEFKIERIPDDLAVNTDPFQVTARPLKDGVYYFFVPQFSMGGSFKLTFTAVGSEDVAPIEHVITVPFNAEEMSMMQLSRHSNGHATSAAANDDLELVLFDESAAAGWTGQSPSKKARSAGKGSKGGKVASSSSGSGGGGGGKSGSFEEVFHLLDDEPTVVAPAVVDWEVLLPMPYFVNLTSKNRLQRKICRGSLEVAGGKMSVFLENSHVVALLDDRAAQEAAAAAEGPEVSLARAEASPSVNEILAKVSASHRMKELSKEGAEIIEQLRMCFEYCFEANVLYAAERKRMKKLLKHLESTRTCHGDVFGAIYLLRFVVFFATAADPNAAVALLQEAPRQQQPQQRSSCSRGAEGSGGGRRSSRSVSYKDEEEEEDRGSPSRSQVRKRDVADRHTTKGLYLLGQVLQLVLRELDDLAIWYFA